eukprot:CAMPEP_0203669104 /NCGR_PEP_ID=MMETSP0090-20130426/5561_1 /ASSEMBLY_ACC=CAM_ASM_001088 /TAXON_ID=426623 /ORGANISM="Chaetoceros affinis, Strain CCMP159" /LENGTH=377 /DNA_ID=CAMNT_0050533705 /DNA_START=83 /DNA_END=1213 /DNA_ORIENTATION=-
MSGRKEEDQPRYENSIPVYVPLRPNEGASFSISEATVAPVNDTSAQCSVSASASASASATATVPSNQINNCAQTQKRNPRALPLSQSKDFRGGQDAWQSMLYDLLAYKVSHNNDTNVKFDKENTKEHTLYLWLQNQRKHYKFLLDGRPSFLNEERIKILEFCGVEWNVRGDTFWENMFEKLKEYKKDHGDCLVPRRWEKNAKLGEWVTDQRRQHKLKVTNRPNLLTDTRERKLNEIGFTWSLRNRPGWDERFEQLADFKESHGHCVVPQAYAQNRALGKWVSKQREQYKLLLCGKTSFMTKERIAQLNDIGFSWSAKGRRNTESLAGTEMLKSTPLTVTDAEDRTTVCFSPKEASSTNSGLEDKAVLPIPQNQETAE